MMIDLLAHPLQTDHRAGRMLEGLIASDNKNAKLLLTTEVLDAAGAQKLHQTFRLKRWQSRQGGVMLTMDVDGTADWDAGKPPIKMLHVDLANRRVNAARDDRNNSRLMRYAADCALAYAWLGEAGLPAPKNGSVRVVEASTCGMCGRTLTDPASIDRGIGPECASKATGSKTILGQESLA